MYGTLTYFTLNNKNRGQYTIGIQNTFCKIISGVNELYGILIWHVWNAADVPLSRDFADK